MSVLRQRAEDYLATRRALGYKLSSQGTILFGYVRYLDAAGATTVTIESALAWATSPADSDPVWWTRRLSVARCFAKYLQAFDPDTQVPPGYLLARGARRAVPYPYTDNDINALMTAARTLRSPLQAATYETIIGLLAVTGMRVGEAIRADIDDVDIDQATVLIRSTKFGKTRLVPLHPSTLAAVQVYIRRRLELCPDTQTTSLFVSKTGTRPSYTTVHSTFARLAAQAGLQPCSPRCRPRIHDLRHRFAVQTLLDWYRSDVDVAARLAVLSTYLGHVKPSSTYWYLSATPELLALAAERLDDHGTRP